MSIVCQSKCRNIYLVSYFGMSLGFWLLNHLQASKAAKFLAFQGSGRIEGSWVHHHICDWLWVRLLNRCILHSSTKITVRKRVEPILWTKGGQLEKTGLLTRIVYFGGFILQVSTQQVRDHCRLLHIFDVFKLELYPSLFILHKFLYVIWEDRLGFLCKTFAKLNSLLELLLPHILEYIKFVGLKRR